MARKQVVEVHCSRCTRVEHREGSSEKPEHVLLAKLHVDGQKDMVVRFEDLCTPCNKTVLALLAQIGKVIEGVSPDRKREAKEKGAANGSAPHPPQPAASSTAASPKPAPSARS